jgi:hypothetical protein
LTAASSNAAGARRSRVGRVALVAIALVIGLAAGTFSYISRSLAIPGPADQASTEELRARGAQINAEFCRPIASEPRFWPECVGGGAAAWEERGARELVEYCRNPVPSRMFTASDCLAEDRPLVALTDEPRPNDAAVAGLAAAIAAVVLALLAASGRFRRLRSGDAASPRA